MPRFVTVLLVVVAFGSASGIAWMLARPSASDPRVAVLESDLRTAQKEISRLREQSGQRSASAPAVAANDANAPSAPDAPAITSEQKKGNLREVLATPGMRAVLEQQQAMQIDVGYGRLFEVLQLNEVEKANLRGLLLAREKEQTDFALKMMDPNLTLQERAKLAQEMQAKKNGYEQDIKTFLNEPNDFATFKQWEDTQPERVQFDMLGRNLFDRSGQPLSPDQEQKLIDLTAQIRKAPDGTAEFTNPATMDPSKMTDALIADYVQKLQKKDEQVAAAAAKFLSPTQLQALNAYQIQARNMAVTSLKMTSAIGGGSGK